MTDTAATSAPVDPIAAADAAYTAALEKAAAPDPKAKELRDTAQALWAQAAQIDGPTRMAARQALQQHNQMRQRRRLPT